jgi:hypothetical protein
MQEYYTASKGCLKRKGKTSMITCAGSPVVVIGPDWVCNVFLCSLLSIVLVLYVVFMGGMVVLPMRCVGYVLLSTWVMLYYIMTLGNPGVMMPKFIDAGKVNLTDPGMYCAQCNLMREKGDMHCLECGVCIKGYHHHCPAMGKCVGSRNLIFFKSFLIATSFSMTYLAVWGIYVVVYSIEQDK